MVLCPIVYCSVLTFKSNFVGYRTFVELYSCRSIFLWTYTVNFYTVWIWLNLEIWSKGKELDKILWNIFSFFSLSNQNKALSIDCYCFNLPGQTFILWLIDTRSVLKLLNNTGSVIFGKKKLICKIMSLSQITNSLVHTCLAKKLKHKIMIQVNFTWPIQEL